MYMYNERVFFSQISHEKHENYNYVSSGCIISKRE